MTKLSEIFKIFEENDAVEYVINSRTSVIADKNELLIWLTKHDWEYYIFKAPENKNPLSYNIISKQVSKEEGKFIVDMMEYDDYLRLDEEKYFLTREDAIEYTNAYNKKYNSDSNTSGYAYYAKFEGSMYPKL